MNGEEDKRKEGAKQEKGKEEKKEEKEEEPPEIVLKVDMHCEGCARKVAKSLRGFEGVEEININCKEKKVVVKGKTADPVKVCERVQKKTGRKAEIISPVPKPPEEEKKEEVKEPPPEEKKAFFDSLPKRITVILKLRMHCEACSQVLQKRIKKMEGVESVETDLTKDQMIVKGFIDPDKLLEDVQRRTRKQASVVLKEEKKEEEEKKAEEEKTEEKPAEEEKKEEAKEEEDDGSRKHEINNKMEYCGPKYSMGHAPYAYPPEMFSDENPNACSIM